MQRDVASPAEYISDVPAGQRPLFDHLRALIQPRNRSWTRPSGPPWRALARRDDAVGLCPRGEATRPEGLPARARAAQSGVERCHLSGEAARGQNSHCS